MLTVAEYRTPQGVVPVAIPALGRPMAHNAGAALAVAWALELDLEASASALAAYRPVGMRMSVEDVGGVVVFNDAYNANPASMAASLGVLAEMGGRRVAVLGDMLELGDQEARWHREVIEVALQLRVDLILTVGPRMGTGARGLVADSWRFEEPERAAVALKGWLRPGDYALFKGSRGAKVERVLHHLKRLVNASGDSA